VLEAKLDRLSRDVAYDRLRAMRPLGAAMYSSRSMTLTASRVISYITA
jgi:hypothetical protein